MYICSLFLGASS